ncbi:clavesin-2-like [Daphnia carinata]|uniref:clavesin-2-like n=1 Tax=Daphnia carinata TaxID=120202 RepID=UPI00257AAF21|nr:clavesin-2-like [Daphnia carinata]
MSEYYDFFWGSAETNRNFDVNVETTDTPLSRSVALESLRSLVLARPDAGSLRFDDEFLIRFLTARQMNVPDAMLVYDNYYRFLRRNHELMSDYGVDNVEVKQALEDGLPGMLQQRDRRGRRIMVLFAAEWDPSRYSVSTIQKAIHISLDLLLQDSVVQDRGLVLIIDWSQFSFRQYSKLQPAVLHSIAHGLEYCYPVRFKSIHCVGPPWYVEAAMSLLKPFLRETSRAKIISYGNNLSILHQAVSREILPAELGGEQGPYQSSIWIDNLRRGQL